MECVYVLGLHRGGSSATAGVVHHLGIPMLIPSDPRNANPYLEKDPTRYPMGDFEDSNILDILWGFTNGPASPGDRLGRHMRTRLRNSLDDHEQALLLSWLELRCRFTFDGKFGVKHSRLATMIRPFVNVLREAGHTIKVVRVKRSITASAKSLNQFRFEPPEPGNYAVWTMAMQWYNAWRLTQCLAILAELKVPITHIQYNDLLDNTEATVKQIADFLGVPVTPAAIDVVRSRKETHPPEVANAPPGPALKKKKNP